MSQQVYLRDGAAQTSLHAATPNCRSNYLTQSQCTDMGLTSQSGDPITPGTWVGSHWNANVKSVV